MEIEEALELLRNRGYFSKVPIGQGRDFLDGVKVENKSDNDIGIAIIEL